MTVFHPIAPFVTTLKKQLPTYCGIVFIAAYFVKTCFLRHFHNVYNYFNAIPCKILQM